MSDKFKRKFKKIYKENKRWIKIIKLLIKDSIENNLKNWINFKNLRFKYRDDLVYYLSDNELNDNRKRLYIFKKFVENIFVLIHDRLNHCDYHTTYDRIMISFYIKKFSRKIQIYIIHYLQCQLNKIIKYLFYNLLQSIQSFAISFHIIIINFIFVLFII